MEWYLKGELSSAKALVRVALNAAKRKAHPPTLFRPPPFLSPFSLGAQRNRNVKTEKEMLFFFEEKSG